MKIVETDKIKLYRSPTCNYNFDKLTGYTEIWGKTREEDPVYCPDGPMILDIEVTDICNGLGGKVCPFCYKSNKPTNTQNMSFETFKIIIDKLKSSTPLTQAALGADSSCTSNPDLFKMMSYAREVGIIPNITVADISDEVADKLVEVIGGCSVSRYEQKDYCYNSVQKLIDRGLTQTNIHIMTALETYEQVMETFNDYLTDKRLEGLNAIVLLSLKKKGRGKTFNQLPQEKFNELVQFALNNNIPLGFDSCSYHKFIKSVENHPNLEQFKMMSEPCESFGLFSSYINVEGKYFPCSFVEGEGEWKDGIDVVNCDDFVNDVWNNKLLKKWRDISLSMDRKCPFFDI